MTPFYFYDSIKGLRSRKPLLSFFSQNNFYQDLVLHIANKSKVSEVLNRKVGLSFGDEYKNNPKYSNF